MLPGDLLVMLSLEGLQQLGFSQALGAALSEIRRERNHGRHIVPHTILQTANQFSVVGQTDRGGEEALGDAEGHINAVRIAPLSHYVAVAEDHPGRVSAFLKRADALAERFASEALIMRQLQIPRRFRLIGGCERDRLIESSWVHPHLLRSLALPTLSGAGI